MKLSTVIYGLAFLLCATSACAGGKSGPWLSIVKSKDGFIFKGHLGRKGFSFDIPGQQMMVANQDQSSGRAMTSIDNIYFSVIPVRKSDFPSTTTDMLLSYRRSEQQYERKQLGRAKLADLDVCKGSRLRRESWVLQALDIKAPAQVYMAVKSGNDIIVISSAYANGKEKAKMLNKFASVCNSFKVTEAQ